MLAIRRFAVFTLVVVGCASPLVAGTATQPLAISKSFTPSTVPLGGTSTTTMTVSINNSNGFSVSGINFSDTYPAGLVPDQVGAYTCSARIDVAVTCTSLDSIGGRSAAHCQRPSGD